MAENYFEAMFERLCSALKTEGEVESISEQFRKLTSDCDRVNYLTKLKSVADIVQLPECSRTDGKKSLQKSLQLRSEGNRFFKAKNFTAALQNYTKSLAASPLPSKLEITTTAENSLSLAFANRSAVLVHLNELQLAINDVENAFRLNYPKDLAYKLHDRKARCFFAMDDESSAKQSFQEALDSLENSQLDEKNRQKWRNDIEKEIAKCENGLVKHREEQQLVVPPSKRESGLPAFSCGNNPIFLSLSSACDVHYEPARGRFIAATRDILPGEVLLVEKPYAAIVLAEHYTNHCYHCFSYTLAPSFVCPSCSLVLYCSEKCQVLSQDTYHKFECPILAAVQESGVDRFAYLALRTLASTPISRLLDYRKAVECGQYPAKDGNFVGCNQFGIYTADNYHAICSLVTHASDRNVHDLFRRGVIAILLLRCLQQSNYFASVGPEDLLDVQSYIGGLLLSHLQSFPCNAHEVSEFVLDENAVAASLPHELGAGIYATLSLFNHSCDPAASRNFYADVCVVRAIKRVRSGCEVSDNYGAVFAVQPRAERLDKLQPQYFFECSCEACINGWPTLPELKSGPPRWRCGGCDTAVHGSASDAAVLCSNCGLQQNLSQNLKELVESEKKYRTAFGKLLKCEVTEALPDLLNHLATMDRLICLPWMDYSCCQEAVKQCFSIMANCYVKFGCKRGFDARN